MNGFYKNIFLIFCSVYLSSCTSSKTVSYVDISLDEILELMRNNYETINSYEAFGTIDLNLQKLKMTLSINLEAKKPDKAIINLAGPFGLDVASILLNGDSAFIYLSMQNKLIKFSLTSDRLNQFSNYRLNHDLLYSAIFSFIDPDSIISDSSQLIVFEDRICLKKFNEKERYDFYFNKSKKIISEIDYSKDNAESEIKVVFQDFYNNDGRIFPQKILIEFSKTGEEILLTFKKLKFNSLEGEPYFPIPDDVEIVEW